MAENCYHPSIEGAQHGAKSLAQFLDYAKESGASGAQPSNYMLQSDKGFKSAKEIKDTFAKARMSLDGVSAHCPFWVHTSAWTGTPSIRPFIPPDVAKKSPDEIETMLGTLLRERSSVEGTRYDEILKMPHRTFFRRRGEPSFLMVSVEGDPIADVEDYIRHLAQVLPAACLASRDMAQYRDLIRKVASGEVSKEEAAKKSPMMKRKTDSVCPCSKGVRWVDTDGGAEKFPQVATNEGGAPTFHCP